MGNQKPRKLPPHKQRRLSEAQEIELLDSWIESQKPDSGSNPLAIPPPPDTAASGPVAGGGFSPYAGCLLFRHLPLSEKTQRGLLSVKKKPELREPKYVEMIEIQRASLPHSLCGRDILGAAKTGSGKTLAFMIPVIEKLYRARWGPEDGVGSIIISPTMELAGQIFQELKNIGKYHSLSVGLLIGGRKDVNAEKERVNGLNILVCTPGRLLQHMNETPNFECSQLQILVLDEADRILDAGFKKEVDAIISQLPRQRQTLLFSATQTKSVKDLARLSLKDPEYISVHSESVTATPERLEQFATEVPLDQKLNMLWSFIKDHLNSKILVFLTTCKQVKFVYEVFKKLRPGIPLKCLHGRMKQTLRMAIYLEFCETTSVLISTDVASRGLDFPAVDWVVQVDCPDDVPTYIHRVGRTARFTSGGKSVLFFSPSEKEMINKLQASEPKIPIKFKRTNTEKIQPISGLLSSLLVKYPPMQILAKKAFATYLRSIKKQRDKEVFDVFKLPIEEYAASLGLAMTPKIRCIDHKMKGGKQQVNDFGNTTEAEAFEEIDDGVLLEKRISVGAEKEEESLGKTRKEEREDQGEVEEQKAPKIRKKKLKINLHKPLGSRVKFDDDGNVIDPLAALADTKSENGTLQPEKVRERYEKLRGEMHQRDKEDKLLHRQRMHEKRTKERTKKRRARGEGEEDVEDTDDSQSDMDEVGIRVNKRGKKIHYDSNGDDDDDDEGKRLRKSGPADSISLAQQEALALKLLSSMNS